jgi:hypothetical protein
MTCIASGEEVPMQRGMNDSIEPDRSNKGRDADELDQSHIDDPTGGRSSSIETEDEQDSLRVDRNGGNFGEGLTGKDAPDGLTQTDDVVDTDDGEELDDSDILEPIESGEAG